MRTQPKRLASPCNRRSSTAPQRAARAIHPEHPRGPTTGASTLSRYHNDDHVTLSALRVTGTISGGSAGLRQIAAQSLEIDENAHVIASLIDEGLTAETAQLVDCRIGGTVETNDWCEATHCELVGGVEAEGDVSLSGCAVDAAVAGAVLTLTDCEVNGDIRGSGNVELTAVVARAAAESDEGVAIEDTHVEGDVTAQVGAAIVATSWIAGSVHGSTVELTASDVGGDVSADDTIEAHDTTLHGAVTAEGHVEIGTAAICGGAVSGVTAALGYALLTDGLSTSGNATLEETGVRGDVSVEGDLSMAISSVFGDVVVSGGLSMSRASKIEGAIEATTADITHSTVRGSLSVGDSLELVDSRVDGDVTVDGSVTIARSIINGGLAVTTDALVLDGSTVTDITCEAAPMSNYYLPIVICGVDLVSLLVRGALWVWNRFRKRPALLPSPATILLTNGSRVTGKVTFTGGRGRVLVDPGSTGPTEIVNGELATELT